MAHSHIGSEASNSECIVILEDLCGNRAMRILHFAKEVRRTLLGKDRYAGMLAKNQSGAAYMIDMHMGVDKLHSDHRGFCGTSSENSEHQSRDGGVQAGPHAHRSEGRHRKQRGFYSCDRSCATRTLVAYG